MNAPVLATRAVLLTAFGTLAACDPGVELGWRGELAQNVNMNCVEAAVRTAAGTVNRLNYDGDERVYPSGTLVTYFSYGSAEGGDYGLELAKLPNGRLKYNHRWLKIGTNVSQTEYEATTPLMLRVNAAIAKDCGMSIGNQAPEERLFS